MVKDTTCPSHGVEFDEEEMEEVMKQLIEGQHLLVNLGEDIPAGTPPWFDEKKFEAGKQFVKKYYGYFKLILNLKFYNILLILWI